MKSAPGMSRFLSISLPETWAKLEESGVLLTVNSRSARSLYFHHARSQSATGACVFETPQIFPLIAWLEQLFAEVIFTRHVQKTTPAPVLLTPEQELLLWEEIILQSGRTAGLLRLKETAGLASQAWDLARAHRIDCNELKNWDVLDYQAFGEWSQEFEKRVRGNGWLDRVGLADFVAKGILHKEIPVPKWGVLAGFDDYTPQELDLFKALDSAGCHLVVLHFPGHESQAYRLGCVDAQEEMRQAALWAKRALQEKPGTRVGVIVSDLAGKKDELTRVFQKILHPEQATLVRAARSRVFNVSLGQSLSEYPVVRAGLSSLRLCFDPMPFPLVSQFLRSSFFKGGEWEAEGRCRVENRLRKSRERFVTQRFLLKLMQPEPDHQGDTAAFCPELRTGFEKFVDLSSTCPLRQSLAGWAQTFNNLLQVLGWPGERSLNSEEYQCVSAWFKGLQRFAALDPMGRDYEFGAALSHLEHLLASSVFQPEQEEAPIQILGQLEAAAEAFDQLWIMGLTDETWPPPARPHPFLPVALQQRLELPHSSAKRELSYCESVFKRLLEAAPRVIVSYPEWDQDRKLFPSPMIAGLPGREGWDRLAVRQDRFWRLIYDSREIESYSDERGLCLLDGTQVRGGAGVLKTQSLCPFQAFARYRLGAEEPEEPIAGLGPPERGTLVHAGLEFFWEQVKTQERLLDLEDSALETVVAQAVAKALNRMQAELAQTFTHHFTGIETDRLQKLLMEWLQQEKARSPFTVIGNEEQRNIEINGLWFRIVVDRIDRLEDGNILVVDYKTGQYQVKDWLGERPAEPQVPFYSLVEEREPAGVYFGLVRKGGCRYIGIGEDDGLIPGTIGFVESDLAKEYGSWKGLLAFWKKQLEGLALEFKQGLARVDPLSKQKSCRYCRLQPLCRIYALERENANC